MTWARTVLSSGAVVRMGSDVEHPACRARLVGDRVDAREFDAICRPLDLPFDTRGRRCRRVLLFAGPGMWIVRIQARTKPPDDTDEKMRHCPLALDGATSTLEDIGRGVRFTINTPDATVAEARRCAHHVVDLAAKTTRV